MRMRIQSLTRASWQVLKQEGPYSNNAKRATVISIKLKAENNSSSPQNDDAHSTMQTDRETEKKQEI